MKGLVLFGFIYPGELATIPAAVLDGLVRRLRSEQRCPPADSRVCQGTLLSREQFLTDIGPWQYRDTRLVPDGYMTSEAVAGWTGAIGDKGPVGLSESDKIARSNVSRMPDGLEKTMSR